jgi:chemotaxis protein histidine kinase CheA
MENPMGLIKNGLAIAVATYSVIVLSATLPQPLPLLTSDQQKVESLALSLRAEPAVVAAHKEVLERLRASAPAQLADGKATSAGAADELVYGALLGVAGGDYDEPKILWIEHLPFDHNGIAAPGARYGGDNPDRIYRTAVINPEHRYEIKGQRHSDKPSLDFSFEAAKGIVTRSALQAKDIEVAKDGSFTITADASPANGRKNHLQVPADADHLLLRDTLSRWDSQLPNQLTISRVDDKKVAAPTRADLVAAAVEEIDSTADWALNFLESSVSTVPANQLKAAIRDISSGVPGAGAALGRFSLQDDEALVITLDPVSAQYLAIQVTDPWTRSVDYTQHFSSLNSDQAIASGDGSFTYVLSAKDPGYANWLDTGGLRDGALVVRWELFSRPTTSLDKAVREVRVVKFDQLASSLPNGVKKVAPNVRKQQLAAREADYSNRLTGK